jgi:hypothetical protein
MFIGKIFGGVGVAHLFLSCLCCVFALFVYVLCLVYLMFPVSLDCPFLITPSVFSNVYQLRCLSLYSHIRLKWYYIIVLTNLSIYKKD